MNKVLDIIRLGLKSLVLHKVRSALSALGIIIGVCSVIAMLAVSEGSSYQQQQALRELGSDKIIIRSEKPPIKDKASGSIGGVFTYGLTWADVACIRDNTPGVRQCVAVHRRREQIKVGSNAETALVLGTEPSYLDMARAKLTTGRFISHMDVVTRRPHCVVTAPLARKLFEYDEPLGKTLHFRGEPFIVVGILRRLSSKLVDSAGEAEKAVLIPISTERNRFGEHAVSYEQGSWKAERVEVSQLILRMADEQAVIDGAGVIRSLLNRSHSDRDYELDVPYELLEQQKEQARRAKILLGAIALVSLAVGGIGIMNIMLASVTERTREIGIRRALGAKRRDITVQFLVESLTLAVVGGALGIAIGWLVPWAVQEFLGFVTVVTATTWLVPFVTALAVGLVSGIYPAMRAAKLDPIVALRHE
jgi:putative ABC transport system permease protein